MQFYPNSDVSVRHILGVAGRWVVPCMINLEHVHVNTFPKQMLQHAAEEKMEQNVFKCLYLESGETGQFAQGVVHIFYQDGLYPLPFGCLHAILISIQPQGLKRRTRC